MLLSRFFNPVQNLADQLNMVQKALTASERLFNLLDVKPDVMDAPDAIEIEKFKGKVEFKQQQTVLLHPSNCRSIRRYTLDRITYILCRYGKGQKNEGQQEAR